MVDLAIEYRQVNDLIPYARNARTHSDKQVAEIAASIREFGWTNPILVDGENGITAGHGRVLAARKLGLESVPVIELSHLTPIQRQAYVLADNKLSLNAGWDDELLALELADLADVGFDVALTGFSLEELDALGDGDADGQSPQTGQLSARFLIPPFSVLNAREGWWQDRKRAWLSLGIKSELGRGDCAPGDAPMPLDRPMGRKYNSEPGGSKRPAADYGKSRARRDGRGKAIA